MATNDYWYFVAMTYDSGVVTLFMNGSWQTNFMGTLNTLDAHFWMGAETVDDGASFRTWYHGTIDDVRLYNRALTTEEVGNLYALESSPRVKVIKAFTVDCANLTVGSNYQLQVSSDMNSWTNWGAPFIATNAMFLNLDYKRVEDWDNRYFRLQMQ